MDKSTSISACCLVIGFLILPFSSNAADPDPLQDICVADYNASIIVNGFPCKPPSEVTSEDFFADLSEPVSTSNAFGLGIRRRDVLSWPGINTQGMSRSRVEMAVGGVNPPHVHPRASELGLLVRGKILVGFVTTDNVLYSKVLTPGMTFIIPRGLVHFQLNVGKVKTLAFSSFNSQLPGTQSLPPTLFNSTPPIPDEVLEKSFLVSYKVINAIRDAIKSADPVFVTGD